MKLKMPNMKRLAIQNTCITMDSLRILRKRSTRKIIAWGINKQELFEINVLYKELPHFVDFTFIEHF